MGFFRPHKCLLMATFFVAWLGLGDAATNICSKFPNSAPCQQLNNNNSQTTTVSPNQSTDSAYCIQICSGDNATEFKSVCPCAAAQEKTTTTTQPSTSTTQSSTSTTQPSTSTTQPSTFTTTTLSTTTPRPVPCFYPSLGHKRSVDRDRRLSEGTFVQQDCQYPGAFGLFFEYFDSETNVTEVYPLCMSTLMDDITLLVSRQCAEESLNGDFVPVYVLTDANDVDKLKYDIFVDIESKQPFDTDNNFFTYKLNTKMVFDDQCIRPVCVPNQNIAATDLELNNCHMPGYGEMVTNGLVGPKRMQEVFVDVDESSIGDQILTIKRVDNKPGSACLGDASAPVFCKFKWDDIMVMIGAVIQTSGNCNLGGPQPVEVYNFLRESPNNPMYSAFQELTYMNPSKFASK